MDDELQIRVIFMQVIHFKKIFYFSPSCLMDMEWRWREVKGSCLRV